jgi:hypothetical protein
VGQPLFTARVALRMHVRRLFVHLIGEYVSTIAIRRYTSTPRQSTAALFRSALFA